MNADGVSAHLRTSNRGGLELTLNVSDEQALRRIAQAFREANVHDKPISFLEFRTSAIGGPNSVYLVRINAGAHEKIQIENSGAGEIFVNWQGDSEYWLECAEKCEPLLESGSGRQYLMVRGSQNQMVTLSFCEKKIEAKSQFAH